MRRAVEREIGSGLFKGAVALVGDARSVRFHEAYGLAAIEPEPVAMVPGAVFDVASITKVVCGTTALAILHGQGKIGLDDRVRRWAPIPDNAGLLVSHLVTHTSGFNDDKVSVSAATGSFYQRALTLRPARLPGKEYVYSGINSLCVGMIVERVAGMPLAQFCQERIFAPLGMRHTTMMRSGANLPVVPGSERIVGVPSDRDAAEAGAEGRAIATAGLFTTARDLARFCAAWLDRGRVDGQPLFPEATWNLFTRPLLPAISRCGVFWQCDATSIHRPSSMSDAAFGHGGHTGAAIWIDPGRGLYTVVLTNRNHPRYVAGPRAEEQRRALARIADALIMVLGENANPRDRRSS